MRSVRHCFIAILFALGVNTAFAQQATPEISEVAQQELLKLIAQLGDDDFDRRELAQQKLKELGLVAFDALHAARYNDDIEIAKRATYLVRSMKVRWIESKDPTSVAKILKDYGEQHVSERRIRIEQLTKLKNDEGIIPLTRMVRYESDTKLSKIAALGIIQYNEPEDAGDRKQLAETLISICGPSARVGSRWMEAFAQTLTDPVNSLEMWDGLSEKEEQTLATFPRDSSREILQRMLRWQHELITEHGQADDANVVLVRMINLLDGTRQTLLDMVEWMSDRELWEGIEQLAIRFPGEFQKYPDLIYRLAESFVRRDMMDEANQTADQALELQLDDVQMHMETAIWLKQRMLYEWSIREFQHVITSTGMTSGYHLWAVFNLSELQHDLLKHGDAAETLMPLALAANDDQDPSFRTINGYLKDTFKRTAQSLVSRAEYFHACDCEAKEDYEKQKEHLNKGFEADPTDGDLLIGMFRYKKADDAWKARARDAITKTVTAQFDEIQQLEQEHRTVEGVSRKDTVGYALARVCNQYAWLVGNTFGDFNLAVKLSHRSLELRKDAPGYLDTLGRCYYAADDLENAIKYQKQAVELDPDSEQMRRQLKMFETALKEKEAN
ncbi:MAG: tetratricopeptide repeat protein [Pirellulaceae bacterium]